MPNLFPPAGESAREPAPAPPERDVPTMVMSGPSLVFAAEVRPGAAPGPVFAPKLGRVMMLFPPCTETPGKGGLATFPVPAPPAPG